jgi:sialate O-acetylesterase
MNRTFPKLLWAFVAMILALSASAKIELHSLFGDNMILQRDASNSLWGWVQPGTLVEVKASWGASAKAKANEDGKWIALLPTPGPGTGHGLTISSGRDVVQIKNVAVGEVWLCAGQSNMGFALGMMFTGEEDTPKANHPDFRIYKSSREHWHEPRERSMDRLARWKSCTPESAAEASAVSYYFGQKLHLALGIPVGVIIQAYAGTPIEGWMPKEIQTEDLRTMAFAREMDERSNRGGNGQAQRKAALTTYEKELADYNARVDAGDIMKNKVRQIGPPFILRPPSMGHQYPSNIYNAMIHPVVPYGIRGMIWYQGERNSKHVSQAFHYRNQLPRMISHYRSIWHNGSWGSVSDNFPVFITQLPSWKAPQTKPVEGLESPWVANRESMLEATRSCLNVDLAVSIDTGSEINLHPKNKKPIGIRHAYLALRNVYGKDVVAHGPFYKSHQAKGNEVILSFDTVGSGLMTGRKGKLNTFAIAGKDRKWEWADAEIKGARVVVSSPNVPHPEAVRYAWAMNPSQRNLLYNKEGLPASPFRTDDWPLFDPRNDKEVMITKPVLDLKDKQARKRAAMDWDRPVMSQ